MSQHDVPLWLRVPAAGLCLLAAWWLKSTDAIAEPVGASIALLGLAVVAGFVLKGLSLPIGLWPDGPWRKTFSVAVVLLVALAFSVLFVLFDPFPSSQWATFDPGLYVVAMAGVVVWGYAWAFVRQRRYVPWMAVSAVVALLPWVLGVLGILGGVDTRECVVPDEMAGFGCRMLLTRALAFYAVLGTGAALVTTELTFRRLVMGRSDRAGVVLVLIAAAVGVVWSLLMGEGDVLFSGPTWWYVAIGGVGAGSLYVLSGSLLAASVYTGAFFGGLEAIGWLGIGANLLSTPAFAVAHGVAALVLLAIVWHRKGLLTGLRPQAE